MKPIYVITKIDDDYNNVEVLGAFNTHAEAVEAIKKNIFYYVSTDDDLNCFDTEEIPNFVYQIHETGIYDVELR